MQCSRLASILFLPSLVLALSPNLAAAATCGPNLGDANADGQVSVVDAQCTIIAVVWELGGQVGPAPSCLSAYDEADLSCDAALSVVDVVISINLVLGKALSPDVDADANNCPDACEAPGEFDCECVQTPQSAAGEWPAVSGAVQAHNCVRQSVGVPPLQWNDALAQQAQNWANTLAATCTFVHSPNGGVLGENLYANSSVAPTPAADVVNAWADERFDWNYISNTCDLGQQCGHFTQIVWDSTTAVGCAFAINPACPLFRQYWVCNYSPPGNYSGQLPYDPIEGPCLDLDNDGLLQFEDPDEYNLGITPGGCDGQAGIDSDGDGYSPCAGDCNDANNAIHPGAQEIVGDGIDNDCDPFTLDDTGGVTCDCIEAPDLALGESKLLAGITLAHNCKRQQVGVPDLTYDAPLAKLAQNWAEQAADACTIAYDPTLFGQLGQNLYVASATTPIDPAVPVQSWMNQHSSYDFVSHQCTSGAVCGNFTQAVWGTTERVGCGYHINPNCPLFKQFWFCFYDPPGNLQGQAPYPVLADPCLDQDGDGITQQSDPNDQNASVP